MPALVYHHIKPDRTPPNTPAQIPNLTSGISTVSEDSLASNPRTLSAEEANDRRNILDHSQAVIHSICLVKFNGFGGFLRVEECC